MLFSRDKSIADNTVGYTKFFLLKKNNIVQINITDSLIHKLESPSTPAGNIIILAINAERTA